MNVGQIMLDLQDCLCTAISDKAGSDPDYQDVCVCSVQWSDVLMLDHCGAEVDCGAGVCGQAWVRLVNVGPDPDVDPATMRCTYAFEVSLEIGIGRCSATGNPDTDDFLTPEADDYISDFLVGTADMDVLTAAVLCCGTKNRASQLAITSIAPFGPEGGCFGTVAQVTMKVTI